MKKSFKFDLAERVFILGKKGVCVVSSRGKMTYVSGGTINLYILGGAHNAVCMEHELVTFKEGCALYKNDGRE